MKPPCFKHSRSRILPTDPRILHLPFLLVITAAYLVALFWFHHMRFTRPTSLTSPEGPSRPQSPWARGRCSPPTGWGCQCQWRACGAPPSCTTTPRAGLPGRRAALLFVPPSVPPNQTAKKFPGNPLRGGPPGVSNRSLTGRICPCLLSTAAPQMSTRVPFNPEDWEGVLGGRCCQEFDEKIGLKGHLKYEIFLGRHYFPEELKKKTKKNVKNAKISSLKFTIHSAEIFFLVIPEYSSFSYSSLFRTGFLQLLTHKFHIS